MLPRALCAIVLNVLICSDKLHVLAQPASKPASSPASSPVGLMSPPPPSPLAKVSLASAPPSPTPSQKGQTSKAKYSERDCEVLGKFFDATNGSVWSTIVPGWKMSDDCCWWKGVQCRSKGGVKRVAELSLANVDLLAGTLPAELGELDSLEILDMTRTQVSGTLAPELFTPGWATRMKTLNVGRSKISGTLPDSLYTLTKLREMYTKYSSISGTLAPEFGRLTSLQQLDISRSKFSGTIPASFSELARLDQLRMYSNKFVGWLPSIRRKLEDCELVRDEAEVYDPSYKKDNQFFCPLPKRLPTACSDIGCLVGPPMPPGSPPPPTSPPPPPFPPLPPGRPLSIQEPGETGPNAGALAGVVTVSLLLVIAAFVAVYRFYQQLLASIHKKPMPLVENAEPGTTSQTPLPNIEKVQKPRSSNDETEVCTVTSKTGAAADYASEEDMEG